MTPTMRAEESEARDQLREIARELEGLRYRLIGVQAGLSSEQEQGPEHAMRGDIECVLVDRLSPAIEALRVAADPSDAREGRG